VPLRIEPVTRTTVWLGCSLVISSAAYGGGIVSHVIVSHEHRFVFMKTRKTAGTSVEIALSRVCGPDDVITPVTDEDEALRRAQGGRGPQNFETPPNLERRAFNHMPVSMVRKMLGRARFESYFSFAIERNPWDAVVSLYHWRFRDESASQPFGDFVASPAVENFATKNHRIYHLKGEIAVDRVLRYESLAAELAAVWSELGLPGDPDLPHAKGGTRPQRPSYRSYYDDASRGRVAELFAAPIAELGYEF
jgi:Sulfotransferase family